MVSSVIIFGFLLLAVFYSLPSNVLVTRSPGDQMRLAFNILSSQDYAFFTKDPESETLDAIDVASWESVLATPQNRPQNLFGLSRTQRAQGPELANLSSDPATVWIACADGETGRGCAHRSSERAPSRVTNSSPVPTVCGDVVLVDRVPVPWSYRKLISESHRTLKTAHLFVACSR